MDCSSVPLGQPTGSEIAYLAGYKWVLVRLALPCAVAVALATMIAGLVG